MANDNKDVEVSRESMSAFPGMPEGIHDIHTTTVTGSDGGSVSRSGWSRDEADQKAGEAFRNGERD